MCQGHCIPFGGVNKRSENKTRSNLWHFSATAVDRLTYKKFISSSVGKNNASFFMCRAKHERGCAFISAPKVAAWLYAADIITKPFYSQRLQFMVSPEACLLSFAVWNSETCSIVPFNPCWLQCLQRNSAIYSRSFFPFQRRCFNISRDL